MTLRSTAIAGLEQKTIFFLRGGIGNQLFIYFAGQAFRREVRREVIYNTRYATKSTTNHGSSISRLNLELPLTKKGGCRRLVASALTRVSSRMGKKYQDMNGVFQPEEVGYTTEIFSKSWQVVWGYFQSFKYLNFSNKSLPRFEFRLPPSAQYLRLRDQALKSRILSVHIRRGDYAAVSETIGVLDSSYYRRAIHQAVATANYDEVWVFTDSLEAATGVMATVSHLDLSVLHVCLENLSDEEELVLMSYASGHVIANSSFSFFGAITSPESQGVYYPSPWFKSVPVPKDLCPPWWQGVASSFERPDGEL